MIESKQKRDNLSPRGELWRTTTSSFSKEKWNLGIGNRSERGANTMEPGNLR